MRPLASSPRRCPPHGAISQRKLERLAGAASSRQTTLARQIASDWRGGFPDSLLAPDDIQSLNWRRDFIRSYLEHDVPMFAPRLPAETIGRLWTMLAHQQGSVLNQSRIAGALGVASPTIDRYIDLLVDLQLLRRLRPWGGNIGKRLVKSPKVYVRDSGILHGLLELETLNDLLGRPVCGLSFEGHCIENLIQTPGATRVMR